MKMRDEVATGQRLQRAMENTGLFPNMVVQMIAVGEESGSLDTMSGKVADFYEARSTTRSTHVEPARADHHGRSSACSSAASWSRCTCRSSSSARSSRRALRGAARRGALLSSCCMTSSSSRRPPRALRGSLLVFGLLVGSFLNVVIHRLPIMLEREWRAQAADAAGAAPAADAATALSAPSVQPCARPARLPRLQGADHAWQNIPVVSWLLLRGRCAACKAPICARYPLVELQRPLCCRPRSPGTSASAPRRPAGCCSPGS